MSKQVYEWIENGVICGIFEHQNDDCRIYIWVEGQDIWKYKGQAEQEFVRLARRSKKNVIGVIGCLRNARAFTGGTGKQEIINEALKMLEELND